MIKIRDILFPIFNRGQAWVVFILILALTPIAIFDDPGLALHMGIGAYGGIVVAMFVQGVAPDEIEIREDEIGPVSTLLAMAPYLHPAGDRVWAPARPTYWRRRDWISIEEIGEGRFLLKARKYELKAILAEIRPRGS